MAITTYATIAELEVRVNTGSADASDDALLQQYLDTAAWLVDKLTRGHKPGKEAFSATSSETRLFDDYGTGTVEIDDLLTATAITRGGTTITTDYYKLWPYNEVPKTALQLRADAPSYAAAGQYWLGTHLRGVGTAQISITGTWGYCALADRPLVVKELTLQIAEMFYMELGLSSQELMAALQNPSTAAQKRIAWLIAPLKGGRRVVLA